jgi:hypothetical protein
VTDLLHAGGYDDRRLLRRRSSNWTGPTTKV